MRILAIDQARHGAWSVFDYEKKELLDYGTWAFENRSYTFEQAILQIEELIDEVIQTHEIDAVFCEDIQLRVNVQSFKKLAQLQGVLVNLCEKHNYQHGLVAPTKWQNFCKARGRTAKEIKENAKEISGKKTSKILSLQAVKALFGVDTENDNLADAIMIGYYVVYNIELKKENAHEENKHGKNA